MMPVIDDSGTYLLCSCIKRIYTAWRSGGSSSAHRRGEFYIAGMRRVPTLAEEVPTVYTD